MEIKVERELCTSCGTCWNELPAFFSYDKNMLAVCIKPSVPEKMEPAVRNVAQICPGSCIILSK